MEALADKGDEFDGTAASIYKIMDQYPGPIYLCTQRRAFFVSFLAAKL